MVAALALTNINLGFSTGNKVHKYYLKYGLSGIRIDFVGQNKL
jgi:hypothetical protein